MELSIPLLDNFCSREWKDRIRYYCPYIGKAVIVVGVYALFIWCMLSAVAQDEHPIQPEIQLKSILVCPMIREVSVIWDLKFDIINTYDDDAYDVCVFGFEVYVFLYNQSSSSSSSLLAKAYANPVSPGECIDPGNRASINCLAEEASTSIQDLINDYFSDDDDDDNSTTNGTIRLDLKLHNHNYDLVCGDAKVELSSIFNSSSSSSLPMDQWLEILLLVLTNLTIPIGC